MNEQVIEIVLALFWTGFVGLNLWLWRSTPLEQATSAPDGIRPAEGSQGEHHATYHH